MATWLPTVIASDEPCPRAGCEVGGLHGHPEMNPQLRPNDPVPTVAVHLTRSQVGLIVGLVRRHAREAAKRAQRSEFVPRSGRLNADIASMELDYALVDYLNEAAGVEA